MPESGNNKNVPTERHTWTKAERQYIQGIVHNYSLQRWTDQDIVNFLWEEKKIKIGRSTVTRIKNQVQQQSEKWYIELRDSSSKYIAIYKERLDSLLSYQKKLHELINERSESYPEIVLRAISELHRIEMSLHTLMKELPGDIKTSQDEEPDNDNNNSRALQGCSCRSTGTITHSKCTYCRQVWCPTTLNQDWCPNPDCSQGIKGNKFRPWDEHFEWVQCSICEMYFKKKEILDAHTCSSNNLPPAIGDIEEEEPLVHQDQVMPKPTVIEQSSLSPVDKNPSPEEEPEPVLESEVDRYWRTHRPKYRPNTSSYTSSR